jgi:pyruvate formate lyase activating enzyme
MGSPATPPISLEAKSPFELRVDLGAGVPETDVRSALASGDLGFLHSFTTGSSVDGPGVRVVAWTTGCQFRCLYCHNPDTWKMSNGIPVPLTRAVEQLGKYRHGLKVMNGGLTVSGGEPLLQDRFVMRLFAAARGMGIHTVLDTNGALHARLADEELASIDLVMLCLKGWDPERHRRLVSADPEASREFARRLARLGRPMWLRWVLVPGWTDLDEEIAPVAEFAASLGNVRRVEVLPFHQMGRYKWQKLGLRYELDDVSPPPAETVDRAVARFRAAGLEAY